MNPNLFSFIIIAYVITPPFSDIQSYVYVQLNDTPSAIEVLFSVLSFPSSLFKSSFHERAVKRLLSIQSEISITIIAYDVHCHAGVYRSFIYVLM